MEAAMLTTAVLLLCLASANAFMYVKYCIDNRPPGVEFPVPCCPLLNGSVCGESLGRGRCMPVKASRSVPPPDVRMDERFGFPMRFFNMTCQCTGNFDGPMCAECKHGFKGNNCDVQYSVLREEIRQMTMQKWRKFKSVLVYCKAAIDPYYYIMKSSDRFRSETYRFIIASYFDVWSYTHYCSSQPFINNTQERYVDNFAHSSTAFLTYHRNTLMLLESQLQRCMSDPYIAIPYLDWTIGNISDFCTDEYFGASDDNGYITETSPFSGWKMLCGGYGYPTSTCLMEDNLCERGRIVREVNHNLYIKISERADIEYCLTYTELDVPPFNTYVKSFRNCLEGNVNRFGDFETCNHNAFHMVIGGTMGQVPISSNDPFFIVHHSYMEKIFCLYCARYSLQPSDYPNYSVYGHRGSDCVTPYYKCILHRDLLVQCSTLGVEYTTYMGL